MSRISYLQQATEQLSLLKKARTRRYLTTFMIGNFQTKNCHFGFMQI